MAGSFRAGFTQSFDPGAFSSGIQSGFQAGLKKKEREDKEAKKQEKIEESKASFLKIIEASEKSSGTQEAEVDVQGVKGIPSNIAKQAGIAMIESGMDEGTVMLKVLDIKTRLRDLATKESPPEKRIADTAQKIDEKLALEGITKNEGETSIQALSRGREESKQQDIISKAEQEIQDEVIQGPSGEVGGRIALAKESLKSIARVKELLFETDKKGKRKFRRRVAGGANVPLSNAPLIGGLIPGAIPFFDDEQEIFRLMGTSLSGRQLIQTGVAARPEETRKLISQFAPNFFSSGKSAFEGLDQLEDFYRSYLSSVDPEKRFPETTQRIKSIESGGGSSPSQMSDKQIADRIKVLRGRK